jgi:uncharacterized DUF497 family protein
MGGVDRRIYCVYKNAVGIEWDEAKRKSTLQQRGLDFASVADAAWDEAMTVEDARSDYRESRFVSLVPIHGRLCVVAWCMRDRNLRVISLRKANARERKRHEEATQIHKG